MNLYSLMLKEQNSDEFRKICTKYIIKGEKNIEIYIPYFIMEELDIKKEKGKEEVEINFDKGETVKGFYDLLYDIVNGRRNLQIIKYVDVEKYMTSLTIKKGYYNVSEIDPEYYGIVIETIIKNVKKEYLMEILEDIVKKCIPVYISRVLYNLLFKYRLEEIEKICSKYTFYLNIDKQYNIENLSLFKNAQIFYNKGSRTKEINLIIKIKKGENDFIWLINTHCNYNTEYDKQHIIYGKEIIFSRAGKILQVDIIKNIIDNQDNKMLQLNSTDVSFIEENRVSKLYIPNNILVELDKNYYEAMKSNKYMISDFEIILTQNESYEAYLSFIEDMLNKKTSIILRDVKDIQKLFIADRFNKNIYKHIYASKHFNYDNFFDMLLNCDTIIIDNIISKLFKHTNANTIYNLALKYHSIPNKCFSAIHLTLKIYIPYNLNILSKFNCIRIIQKDFYPIYIIKNTDHYLVSINNINTIINSGIFSHITFSIINSQIKLDPS